MQQVKYHHTNVLVQEIGQKLQTQLETRDSKMYVALQQIPRLIDISSSSEDN